jgi:hypothetical protein
MKVRLTGSCRGMPSGIQRTLRNDMVEVTRIDAERLIKNGMAEAVAGQEGPHVETVRQMHARKKKKGAPSRKGGK